jgi:predicted 3-demethylubiquinone-9 3-methyltransferase (glyoxalase superfamily)
MSRIWKPTQKISPFLWFENNAEEAVNRYIEIFPESKIVSIARYTRESAAVSGQPEGSVMTIGFVLDGQEFGGINGGPHFKFTEAISFVVNCESQQELDHYWEKLGEGGNPAAQQCGWLKDRFGVSWQVVPVEMFELMEDPDPAKAARVAQALYSMKKIDLSVLRAAHKG